MVQALYDAMRTVRMVLVVHALLQDGCEAKQHFGRQQTEYTCGEKGRSLSAIAARCPYGKYAKQAKRWIAGLQGRARAPPHPMSRACACLAHMRTKFRPALTHANDASGSVVATLRRLSKRYEESLQDTHYHAWVIVAPTPGTLCTERQHRRIGTRTAPERRQSGAPDPGTNGARSDRFRMPVARARRAQRRLGRHRSGLFAYGKSIAPSQISFISVGPDQGHEVLPWLGDLMGVAPDNVTLRRSDEWEFALMTAPVSRSRHGFPRWTRSLREPCPQTPPP